MCPVMRSPATADPVGEADDPAEWARIMAKRYHLGADLNAMTAEAEALTSEERESVQWMFEWLHFEGKLAYRFPKASEQ